MRIVKDVPPSQRISLWSLNVRIDLILSISTLPLHRILLHCSNYRTIYERILVEQYPRPFPKGLGEGGCPCPCPCPSPSPSASSCSNPLHNLYALRCTGSSKTIRARIVKTDRPSSLVCFEIFHFLITGEKVRLE